MPTPMKTILRETADKKAPRKFKNALNNFHQTALAIAGDGSMLITGQKFGLTIPASVAIKNNLRRADLYSFEKNITALWQKNYDMKETMFFPELRQKTSGKGIALDDWIDDLNIRRISGDTNFNTQEAAAVELLERYFAKMKQEGLDSGVLGSVPFLGQRVLTKEVDIELAQEQLEAVMAKSTKSLKGQEDLREQIAHWKARVKVLQDEFAELNQNLEQLKKSEFKLGPDEPFLCVSLMVQL